MNHGGNRRRAAILSVLLTSTPLVPVDDLLSAKSGSLIASAEAMSASASSGLNERAETDHFQGSGVRHMEDNVQEGSASRTLEADSHQPMLGTPRVVDEVTRQVLKAFV